MKITGGLIENYRAYEDKTVTKEELTALYKEYVEITNKNIQKGEQLKLNEKKRRNFNAFMKANAELIGFFKILNR